MNVNRIGFNPNFGMALIIKRDALPELEKCSKERLEIVKKIGEEHKNDQFVDIVIAESLYNPIIKYKHAGNAYSHLDIDTKEFVPKNEVKLIGKWESDTCSPEHIGEKVTIPIYYNSASEVDGVRSRLKGKYDIERASEIAKELEKHLAKKDAAEKAERAQKALQRELASSLYDEFGEE